MVRVTGLKSGSLNILALPLIGVLVTAFVLPEFAVDAGARFELVELAR